MKLFLCFLVLFQLCGVVYSDGACDTPYIGPGGSCGAGPHGTACNCTNGELGYIVCQWSNWTVGCGSNGTYNPPPSSCFPIQLPVGSCNLNPRVPQQQCLCNNGEGYIRCVSGAYDVDQSCSDCATDFDNAEGFCTAGAGGKTCPCANGASGEIRCVHGVWGSSCGAPSGGSCGVFNDGALGFCPAGSQSCACTNGQGSITCADGNWNVDAACRTCVYDYQGYGGFCAGGPNGKSCACTNAASGNIQCVDGGWLDRCGNNTSNHTNGGETGNNGGGNGACASYFRPAVGYCSGGDAGKSCECSNRLGRVTCRQGRWSLDSKCLACNYSFANQDTFCEAGPTGTTCACNNGFGEVVCRNTSWHSYNCGATRNDTGACPDLQLGPVGACAGDFVGVACPCSNGLGHMRCELGGEWSVDAACTVDFETPEDGVGNSDAGSSSSNTAAIAASSAVGGVVLLSGIGICFVCRSRMKKSYARQSISTDGSTGSVTSDGSSVPYNTSNEAEGTVNPARPQIV